MTAMAAGRARSRWGRWDGRPRTRAHPRFPAGARASRGCARWTDRAGCSRALVCPRRCVDRVGGAGGDHSTPASPSPSGSFTSVAGGRLRLLRRRGEIGGRGMGAATCPAPAWARGVGGGTGLVGRVGGVGSGGRVVGAFDRLLPRRRRRDLATAPVRLRCRRGRLPETPVRPRRLLSPKSSSSSAASPARVRCASGSRPVASSGMPRSAEQVRRAWSTSPRARACRGRARR